MSPRVTRILTLYRLYGLGKDDRCLCIGFPDLGSLHHSTQL